MKYIFKIMNRNFDKICKLCTVHKIVAIGTRANFNCKRQATKQVSSDQAKRPLIWIKIVVMKPIIMHTIIITTGPKQKPWRNYTLYLLIPNTFFEKTTTTTTNNKNPPKKKNNNITL